MFTADCLCLMPTFSLSSIPPYFRAADEQKFVLLTRLLYTAKGLENEGTVFNKVWDFSPWGNKMRLAIFAHIYTGEQQSNQEMLT